MKCNRKYNRNKKAAASLLILSCLAAPSLAEEELPCRSHFWELANFPLADGSVCLLAVNKSDNDWNPMALVLSLEEGGDTLTPLANLTKLTRQSDETPDNLLSSWARIGYPAVLSAEENAFTVPWTESLNMLFLLL